MLTLRHMREKLIKYYLNALLPNSVVFDKGDKNNGDVTANDKPKQSRPKVKR